MREAAAGGATFIALPEMFAFLRREGQRFPHAQGVDGEIVGRVRSWARELGVRILAGSIAESVAGSERVHNTSVLVDASGATEAVYRKIHLFDVDLPDSAESYRESASMDRGGEIVTVDTPVGRLGVTICYDVRFPELYRRLVDAGATVLSVAAAFTRTTGEAHWHALLRARAIENLSYVVAAAQHGRHPNGRQTFGHSMIIDPWGRVLAEQEAGDGLVIAGIDPILPGKIRRGFPVLEHRRLGELTQGIDPGNRNDHG